MCLSWASNLLKGSVPCPPLPPLPCSSDFLFKRENQHFVQSPILQKEQEERGRGGVLRAVRGGGEEVPALRASRCFPVPCLSLSSRTAQGGGRELSRGSKRIALSCAFLSVHYFNNSPCFWGAPEVLGPRHTGSPGGLIARPCLLHQQMSMKHMHT